jgi:UDP-N-acetylglucosamine 4,6-dehydratase
MLGGEVFVPKIPSMTIRDLAQAVAPGCEIEMIGIRAGEKLHELLVSEDEARHTLELDDRFVIQPVHPWWTEDNSTDKRKIADGFSYSSDDNPQTMAVTDLKELVTDLIGTK